MTPNIQCIRGKINKLILRYKICSATGPIKNWQRYTMEWAKIFANNIFNYEIIPRLYNGLSTFNSKRHIPSREWAKDMKRYFTKEGMQMANNYMKQCSAPLAIRKRKWNPQWDTTVYLSVAKVKNRDISKCWQWC